MKRKAMADNPDSREAPLERLLTAREAAELLNVSVPAIYSWAACGWLPAQRVGRCLRFRPRDLEAWLASQRRPA